MKLVKLRDNMPLAYMMRHWWRWYYVDYTGNIMPMWEVVKSMQEPTNDKQT